MTLILLSIVAYLAVILIGGMVFGRWMRYRDRGNQP